MDWLLPLALYALGLAHHWWAWRREARASELAAVQMRQLLLVREAAELSRYGAKEEAAELLEEAIKLGEKA